MSVSVHRKQMEPTWGMQMHYHLSPVNPTKCKSINTLLPLFLSLKTQTSLSQFQNQKLTHSRLSLIPFLSAPELQSARLGFIVIIALVVIGLVCNRKCFDLSLMNTFLLFLTMSMGFSSLLHFMLPRKRPEVFVEDDDTSETQSFIKKHQIGSLTSATAATANDGDESGDVKSNVGFIGNINSSNHSSGGGSVMPEMALGDGNPPEIDEDLHSRQLAVYGCETMRQHFASNILVSGMQGLGAEILNLVLAGVKSVTLHDEGTVELWDLFNNFIFSESNVGKNRALASVQKLQELNNVVVISTLTTKLTEEQLSNFQTMNRILQPQ
ncbi:unnamed protein product [Camellia sinensis]